MDMSKAIKMTARALALVEEYLARDKRGEYQPSGYRRMKLEDMRRSLRAALEALDYDNT